MSDEAVTWPTPAEVAAAGLVAVTTWEEIDAALANGQGPLRTANAAARNFPPVTQGYVTAPKPVDYTVTFNSEGGSAVSATTVRAGTSITAPAAPTQTGFTFDGWFLSPTNTMEAVVFPYTPDGDVTLYAAWTKVVVDYTVAFNGEGGSSPTSITVAAGSSITLPTSTRA